MARTITVFEADDGQRFETLAACEQYESNNRELYLLKLRDEISYREVPLFEERRYGAYIVPPVTIITATPRNMKELIDIAEYMRNEIGGVTIMPGFVRNSITMQPQYTGATQFPMVYSVMVERYRRRKHPIVKLFTGYEFSRLANLCTGGGIDPVPNSNSDVPIRHPVSRASNSTKHRTIASKPITIGGTTKTAKEWAKQNGVPMSCVYSRVNDGWDLSKAISIAVMPYGTNRYTVANYL